MSRIYDWTQITAASRTGDLRESLQARIADPHWMLARQWQFGAFKGEDAGTPLRVGIKHGAVPVDQMTTPSGRSMDLGQDAPPVESIIEAEPVETGPAAPRRAGEAGLDFLRRIPKSMRETMLLELQRRYPLRVPTKSPRVLVLLADRSFDAARLRKTRRATIESLVTAIGATAEERGGLRDAFANWSGAYDRRFVNAPDRTGVWNPSRLEYEFALSARRADAVLNADGYAGGRFDWFQVDMESRSDKTFDSVPPGLSKDWVIPTRIRYAGMPARRFWHFENAEVFFARIEAESTDLSHLVLTEFATVYSDDWYFAPVPIATGALGRVAEVEVIDTFGETRPIPSAAVQDGPDRSWRFFELTGDRSPDTSPHRNPWLYIPRVAESIHEGAVLEQTEFMRDEAANLAWGIETRIERSSGEPLDRHADWMAVRDALVDEPAGPILSDDGEEETPWRYILETLTPPFWIPFLPEIEDDHPNGMLRRSRMRNWELLGAAMRRYAGPKGLFTKPDGPLSIHDEEIPRGGLVLTRSFQATRDAAGHLRVWAGRRKRPAGAVKASGRETDIAVGQEGQLVDSGREGETP